MKCPRCDADLTAQRKCSKCDLNVDDYRKDLEIEYKDFKTSELLEIRHKMHPVPSETKTTTVKEQPMGKTPDTKSPSKSSDDAKNFFPILAIVVLVLILITGAFFLFRFFITQ